MSIFKGLIKCLHCGKNYKKKMERKRVTYVCSGYANYSKERICSYRPIHESDLIDTITKHLELHNGQITKPLYEYVYLIEVKDSGYRITYTDKTQSLINWETNKYGVKVRY